MIYYIYIYTPISLGFRVWGLGFRVYWETPLFTMYTHFGNLNPIYPTPYMPYIYTHYGNLVEIP